MTMPIPDGSVVITPRQMYDEIQETRKSVDRLTNTLDPALSDLRGDVNKHGELIAQHELDGQRLATRVTIVETKLKVVWGLVAFLIAALGVLAGFYSNLHGAS